MTINHITSMFATNIQTSIKEYLWLQIMTQRNTHKTITYVIGLQLTVNKIQRNENLISTEAKNKI